jgi:hypothetical protein
MYHIALCSKILTHRASKRINIIGPQSFKNRERVDARVEVVRECLILHSTERTPISDAGCGAAMEWNALLWISMQMLNLSAGACVMNAT